MRINIDENNVYLLSSIADTIIDNGWDKNPLFEAYIYPLSYSGNVGKKYYKGEKKFCASCESQLVVDSNNKIYTCWWGAYNKEFEVGYIDNNVHINEYKIMRIKAVGNSMIPTIKSDEYVIFEKQKNYSMNDIILYFSNNQFKIHRIIKLKERNFFTVKGDNETYREDIHLDDIIGVLNRNSVLEQNEKQYLLTVNKYQIKVYFKNHTLKDIAINEKYY